MLGDSFTIWVKQTFASYRQGQHQNYSLENRLCHAAVTGEGYPMFNDFGHEEHKTTGRELNREDKMTSNYQVAKFLANERVNEQLGSAKHYRLAESANEGQGNKRIEYHFAGLGRGQSTDDRHNQLPGQHFRGVGDAVKATR